jgi:hypothetical protein
LNPAPLYRRVFEDAQNIIKMIRSFTQTVLSDGKYITGEDGRAALLRTLFADHSHRQLLKILFHTPDVKNESDMITLWETFEKSFLDDDGEANLFFKSMRAASSPPSSVPRTVQDVFEVFQAIQFVLSRSQFIVSETGYFGLMPKVTRRHDAIVRIQGTKTPFVVRSVGTEGRCVLVGPCYVHGFMYGDIPYDYNKSGVVYLV